jgi:hypothetical protein
MNIAHEFQKVGFFLAKNGFKTVLKQMAKAASAAVKPDGIPRQQASHNRRNRNIPGAQKQMKVIGHQGPGKASGLCIQQDLAHPVKKVIAVGIPVEYLPAFNPANHNMVYGANGIYA